MITRHTRLLALALGLLLVSSSAFAATYVLEAGNWGSKQKAAVAAAGGEVTFVHDRTGVAIAQSSSPGFINSVLASGAFQSAAEDFEVNWQPNVQNVDAEEVNASNDTYYPIQWAPKAIEAPAAWAAGYTGKGVRVAVLDGGIYAAHVDLAANIDVARSKSFVTGFAFNQDTGTFWHGTHVAGIIAAIDNSRGVVGIAPEATIVGVKVLHSGSGSFGAIIQGVAYAATPIEAGGGGADIINMSLGASFAKNLKGAASLISALNKVVNYAASQGVLVVSSAGNDGTDYGQFRNEIKVPAQSGTGIAVSATGPYGWAYGNNDVARIASYTDYGEDLVTIAGPGGDFAWPTNEACTVPVVGGSVTTACWVFDMVVSTTRGGGTAGSYGWAAGTSMAAPAVSAVAALIKQKNPGISLGALEAKLLGSATDEGKKGHDQFYGRGFVNARRAVE